jgi:hypothetical protein
MSVTPNSTQSSQIDALFTPGLVAAQQPKWPDKDALAKAEGKQQTTLPPVKPEQISVERIQNIAAELPNIKQKQYSMYLSVSLHYMYIYI